MTYPTEESKRQKKLDKKAQLAKEAELYIDCKSFEEFELKRTIVGMVHNMFNDIFKCHYFCYDKCRWLMHDDFGIFMVIMTVASNATSIIFYFGLGADILTYIALPFTAVWDILFLVCYWLWSNCIAANSIIEKVKSSRRSEDARTITAKKPICSISSYVSCASSYIPDKTSLLSC